MLGSTITIIKVTIICWCWEYFSFCFRLWAVVNYWRKLESIFIQNVLWLVLYLIVFSIHKLAFLILAFENFIHLLITNYLISINNKNKGILPKILSAIYLRFTFFIVFQKFIRFIDSINIILYHLPFFAPFPPPARLALAASYL